MLNATTATTKAYDRLKREIQRSPATVQIPTARDIEAAIARGDRLLLDPADAGRATGAIAWISAEPSWDAPEELFAVHIWGPSARHLDILIDVCRFGVDAGIGDLPISYQRSSHPLTVLADAWARVTISRDGKHSTTTLRNALAGLTAHRDEVVRGRRL